jgi:hypothetical protein
VQNSFLPIIFLVLYIVLTLYLISKYFKHWFVKLYLVIIIVFISGLLYFLAHLPIMSTKDLKKMPHSAKELKILDSIKLIYKNCYKINREEIIYYPVKIFDKKYDYIVNIRINDSMKNINKQKFSNDAFEIINKVKKIKKDENKIKNYIIRFEIMPIIDTVLINANPIEYSYKSKTDTIFEFKSKNN